MKVAKFTSFSHSQMKQLGLMEFVVLETLWELGLQRKSSWLRSVCICLFSFLPPIKN